MLITAKRLNLKRLLGPGGERLKAAGDEVVAMLGGGAAGMKPKAAIAVAAEAFEDAGKKQRSRKSKAA